MLDTISLLYMKGCTILSLYCFAVVVVVVVVIVVVVDAVVVVVPHKSHLFLQFV